MFKKVIIVSFSMFALSLSALAQDLPKDVFRLHLDSPEAARRACISQYLEFAQLPVLGKIAFVNDRDICPEEMFRGYSNRMFVGIESTTNSCGVVTYYGYRDTDGGLRQELEVKDFREYHCKNPIGDKDVRVGIYERDADLTFTEVMRFHLDQPRSSTPAVTTASLKPSPTVAEDTENKSVHLTAPDSNDSSEKTAPAIPAQ